MKNWLILLSKAVLLAALVWFLVRSIDIVATAKLLRSVDVLLLAASALVLMALFINNTVRWWVVMNAIDSRLSFLAACKILYIGLFFNQTLPSTVGGDAVRIYLARKSGLTLQGAVNGVMLERVATLAGLILVVVVTQPLLLARIGDNPAKWVFPAMAVVLVAAVVLLMFLDRLPEGLRRWAFMRWLAQLAHDTRRLFLAPSRTLRAVGLGVTGNLLLSTYAWVLTAALGLEVSLLDCLVLIPPVIVISTIPVSIAGWGLREVAMVGAFAFIGMSGENALGLSILFGLVNMVMSIPGGILWLHGGYSRKDVADEATMP